MIKEHKTTGTICLSDQLGFEYHIAKLEYILYEDESFEYIFTPFYNVIDILPPELFQGIPGLDLDLRLKKYVRKDIIPVFISERTPGENREDLWELLESVNMDYLDRLEWLIRTDLIYSGDFMYVKRYENGDEGIDVEVDVLDRRMGDVTVELMKHICRGDNIYTEDYCINNSNRLTYYTMLLSMLSNDKESIRKNRIKGIKKAAEEGKYRGRKRIEIDDFKYETVLAGYCEGRIGQYEAMAELGVSRATFFRRLNEYRKAMR